MSRRWFLGPFAATAGLAILAAASFGQEEPASGPIGFRPGSRSPYLKAEAKALAVPTPERARAWLRTITAEPHIAGSPANHRVSLFIRDKLREWGWDAEFAEYEVLLNQPSGPPELEILAPSRRELSLSEAPLPRDKDSASSTASPAFHGYGVSGQARGQVVYVNYGRPDDFAALEKLGIEIRDKIVLVRYGEIFRGLKVRNAQKKGAKGVLIYSDPADDGYARGDVYPDGPFRPGSAIQRGSVQFLSLQPGDPSTPRGPSTPGASRLPIDYLNGFPLGGSALRDWEKATGLERADVFPTIPSLPIGYDSARAILEVLGGPNVPPGWQGGLPLAYHVGPGPAEVRLAVRMSYQVKPIRNVIAKIKGAIEPDHWVMLSNHHDAWVYGAVDPGSGTATTLETCRAIGAAVKQGWKPRRTIVYASWDAEEYGLVGSTEWAEDHEKEVGEKAVLLLNVDSAVAGSDLDADGVPSLRDLMLDAAGAVNDVRTGQPLRKVWIDARRRDWARNAPLVFFDPLWDPVPSAGDATPEEAPRHTRFSPALNDLGSGSDYTPFLDHLGVPALDIGFKGRYGVYHSIYDNLTWMERFGDPEFVIHATAAKLYTAIVMRAAAADVLPMKFVPYGEALRSYVDELRGLVERKARAIEPGDGQTPLTFDGLTRLVRAIRSFQAQASSLDRATEKLTGRDDVETKTLDRLNAALAKIERSFLLPQGLSGRPWFKHAIYAPGVTTGYASWPLPGVRQAILEGDPKRLAQQLPALVERIEAATRAMKAAAEVAEPEGRPAH